jgi:kumamolisin
MAHADLVPVRGTEKRLLAQAEPAGSLEPDEQVDITVILRSRTDRELARETAGPRAEQERLSREAFADRFGADPADAARVEAFAARHALRVIDLSLPRRSVVLAGSISRLSEAFNVRLGRYAHPEVGTFRGRQGAVYVPVDLSDIVLGVFGLDDRPVARPHLRRLDDLQHIRPLVGAPRASFTPPQIASLYNFPRGLTGRGQCVAIIELGGGFVDADLDAYFRQLGLPRPEVVAVSVDQARNQPGGPDSADGEVMLDIEVVGAVAPGAKIAVYFAPNTDRGFIDAVTTAAHDAQNQPSVMSISWGAPEVGWTQASLRAMDQAFQAAAAMGVTVYCAAGDNGASDFPGGQSDQPGNHADFPASSPHVVGCGGTHITVADDAISHEVVWNDPGGGASGGGFSEVFDAPVWQTGALSGGKRGVPDVAGNASPLSGYVVRVDGRQSVIGGTSAVAPLWAGLTALFNEHLGQPLGFANPVIYRLGASSRALVDITQGDNNGFQAGPGWDACTGLGRPDGARLLAALTSARERQPPSH